MPGLNERWQIFHISYPEGIVSRITNDWDSYGSRTTDPFQRRRNLVDWFTADGRLFASRAHATSEVLLIKNFAEFSSRLTDHCQTCREGEVAPDCDSVPSNGLAVFRITLAKCLFSQPARNSSLSDELLRLEQPAASTQVLVPLCGYPDKSFQSRPAVSQRTLL
jgi:hypothetical protein